MQHKGEIVEKAVRESGHSITKLAEKMGKSRRWVYQIFDSANVPIDYIMEIGRIIHHDFSEEIRGIKIYTGSNYYSAAHEDRTKFSSPQKEIEYWKHKFFSLEEKYNELLSKRK